jgi:diguanylate cyclase (GGDEF)-like protein
MCARSGQPLTLALADLDHFKAFNDAHGHEAGDVLLKDFSRITSTLLRDVDVVARWGGEEFAIALPGSDETAAKVALDRLRQAVPDDQTCSFGIARWDGSESITACLARADAALYRAKAAGRDRVAL